MASVQFFIRHGLFSLDLIRDVNVIVNLLIKMWFSKFRKNTSGGLFPVKNEVLQFQHGINYAKKKSNVTL